MMKSRRLFSLGSTEILLHPAMILYMGYALLSGNALFMLVSTFSILLHEASHAAVSALLGYAPAALELTPLGAVMRLEDETRIPRGKHFVILLAGPLCSFLLCILAIKAASVGYLPRNMGSCLFLSNLAIVLINLAPVLPLDGGRMLTILLSLICPARIAAKIMRILGLLVGFSLILLNIWSAWKLASWNLSLAFVGCCLIYSASAATTTRAAAELRAFMDRKIMFERQGRVKAAPVCVLSNDPLMKAVHGLPEGKMAIYLCFEPGSMRWIGALSEHDAIQTYLTMPAAVFSDALKSCQSSGNFRTNGTN